MPFILSPWADKQRNIKGLVTVWHTSPHKLAFMYNYNSSIDSYWVLRMTFTSPDSTGAKPWRLSIL